MSLEILLIKSNNCGHCIRFLPIFLELQQQDIHINELKNIININISVNIADYERDVNEKFLKQKGLHQINGYPVIFIIYYDKSGNRQYTVELDDRGDNITELKNNIVKFFNKNLKDKISKQSGGDNSYYSKYLKYKNKYLELKNNHF
jgi:thiol-disulfide isomerase/thioredoxin